MLESNEEVVEWIPWRLMKWCEQTVARNDEWWISLQATLKTFWDDVERAKRGEFTIPESTRPSKKAKTMPSPTLQSMPCMIQFHKLDENGQPYTETLDGL